MSTGPEQFRDRATSVRCLISAVLFEQNDEWQRYSIVFFHVNIDEMQTSEGNLYLFVVIARTRTDKFAVAQLVEKADWRMTWEFLKHLLEMMVLYRIHMILIDNGIQFADQTRN
ncbi:MAG: hypothetical protein ACK5II_02960 [Paracoccus sp. (in: a-proteobacteria)]|uniref:hypothetical protein n=1 Tax=Microbacterium sp. TaxID=51671 RepID=UPI003A85B7F2